MPTSEPIPQATNSESEREVAQADATPPILESSDDDVIVEIDGVVIARTTQAIRVLEAGYPPVMYIPPEDVRLDRIVPETGSSFCPWKGYATYYGIRTDTGVRETVAWCYPEPLPRFEPISRYLAFYPDRVDRFTVNGVDLKH